MGAVKDYFMQVEESIVQGNYAEALELLKPWGDDAPNQLYGLFMIMAADRLGDSQDLPRKKFSGQIFCEQFIIKAQSQEQAEEIYNAYHTGNRCPVHGIDAVIWECDCYESWEEVGHTMEEWDINE